jgi:hypothetical protein
MKKLILVSLLLTLFVASARGQEPSLQKPVDPPKPTILHRVFDKKFLVVTAINVGVSIGTTLAIAKCRQDHGIGPCQDGGYGPFPAREALRQGLTGFLILPSFKVKAIEDRDNDKHKFWWLIQTVPVAINTQILVSNRLKHYGPKEN